MTKHCNYRIPWQKKIAFSNSDPGDTLDNKLNDLKPLYSRTKSFAFQKKFKENALALEGINSCRLAWTQTLCHFSFRYLRKYRRAKRARENERGVRERKKNILFFPHHYPLALAVNKSSVVYILSPALDGLWRENRGSVNRLLTDQNKQQPQEIKGLFTCRWETPVRWGNPLRWGSPPVHIISHFNLTTFTW